MYDVNDVGLINMFDSFCLAEGYEIKDCSYSSLLVGIAKYVDGCFDSYKESKWDMQDNRTYEILGRALCWLGESESGQELYNTFSEVLGMDDDEIRKMGFTSLVPYFDRDKYAELIANYLIDEGTEDTLSGNIHFPFSEINERFKVNLPSDVDLLGKIEDCLISNSEIVSDCEINGDFDLMFFTAFCPHCEDRFAEDDQSPTMEM